MVRNDTTGGVNMKIDRSVLIVLLIGMSVCGTPVMGQDLQAVPTVPSAPLQSVEQLHAYKIAASPIAVACVMPQTFKNTAENRIADPNASLFSFFRKLERLNAPVRIVHIGDSHVRGHVLTRVVRHNFERDFGGDAVYPDSISYFTAGLARETGRAGVVYHAIGVNGATIAKFTGVMQIREIKQLHPDLIIISFGTNESHFRNYNAGVHEAQMDEFVSLLKEECGEAALLFTTPPGSYLRSRRSRNVNTRTGLVAQTICHYAHDKGYAYWDLFTIVGGSKRAALNWTDHHYMLRDRLHYNEAGYTLQGNLLYEAFIKAYNDYVVN